MRNVLNSNPFQRRTVDTTDGLMRPHLGTASAQDQDTSSRRVGDACNLLMLR